MTWTECEDLPFSTGWHSVNFFSDKIIAFGGMTQAPDENGDLITWDTNFFQIYNLSIFIL